MAVAPSNVIPIYFENGDPYNNVSVSSNFRDGNTYRVIEATVNTGGMLQNIDIGSLTFFTDIPLKIQLKIQGTNYQLEIHDDKGRLVWGSGSPGYPPTLNVYTSTLFTTIPHRRYTISHYNSGANNNANFRIWDMRAYQTIQRSNYLTVPFSLCIFDPRINISIGTWGTATITFTNFPVTSGTVYNLLTMQYFKQMIDIAAFCSDTTVFANQFFGVNLDGTDNQSYTWSATGLKNTFFTGTFTVGMSGAGTDVQVSLLCRRGVTQIPLG